VLLLEEQQNNKWLVLVKPGRFAGREDFFEPHRHREERKRGLSATVLETDEATGGRVLQFEILHLGVSLQVLDSFGQVPLPPYYKFSGGSLTVSDGLCPTTRAIAAPTAGLHFTQLLSQLQERGIGSVL